MRETLTRESVENVSFYDQRSSRAGAGHIVDTYALFIEEKMILVQIVQFISFPTSTGGFRGLIPGPRIPPRRFSFGVSYKGEKPFNLL